jgi:hypothetical protein
VRGRERGVGEMTHVDVWKVRYLSGKREKGGRSWIFFKGLIEGTVTAKVSFVRFILDILCINIILTVFIIIGY